MKRMVWMCCFSLLLTLQAAIGLCQSSSSLQYFNVYSHNASSSEFQDLLTQIDSKKGKKSDKDFLRYVFTKTHKLFLKKYESNADFKHLVENGSYNCLTGTALYALILNHAGYEFRIIETNYHIFLVVNCESGYVLFEATDPSKGFITDPVQIASRIAKYKENKTGFAESGPNYYRYSFRLFNEVNLDQMQGLLFYNEAIESFNARDLPMAVNYLDKAIRLYNSPRIQEFSKIVLLTLMQAKMDVGVKETCVKKIQSIQKQKIPAITSSAADLNFN